VALATSSPPSARLCRLPSGRPKSGPRLTSSGSARPLPPAESSCRSSSDSKVYTGWGPASPRTAQSSRRRSPRPPGWLLHVTMLPTPRPWECRKPCRSCGIPPGRPVDPPCLLDDTAPSLLRHYSGLSATTSGSVPWRRIAIVGLAFRLVPFACHRRRRFPQFTVRA
jgi:hypothetical protein